MAFLFFVIAAALLWFFGWQILRLIDKEEKISTLFKAAAAYPLGAGIFSLLILIWGSTTLSYDILNLIRLYIISIGTIFGFLKHYKLKLIKFNFSLPKINTLPKIEKAVLVVLLITLLWRLIIGILDITRTPTYEFDAWHNWNLRAKVISVEGRLPLNKNDEFYLGGGVKSYPLNDGLTKTWLATMSGGWNENIVGLHSLLIYLSLIGILYAWLPTKRVTKLAGTYFLTAIPFLTLHSWVAYADLTISTYIFITAGGITSFIISRQKAWLTIGGLGLAMAIWTKNEGFAVIVPALIVASIGLLIFKHWKIKEALKFWLIGIGVSAPWLIFRTINKLDILSGDSSSFNWVFNNQFFLDVIHSMFFRNHFNLLFFLLLILIALKGKPMWHSKTTSTLLILLAPLLGLYLFVFLFSDRAIDLSAYARSLLHIAPLALATLIVGYERVTKKNV